MCTRELNKRFVYHLVRNKIIYLEFYVDLKNWREKQNGAKKKKTYGSQI